MASSPEDSFGYKRLAAAIIQNAVEDIRELKHRGFLLSGGKLNFRRLSHASRQNRAPMEIDEAVSAVSFFQSKGFTSLSEFCGVDDEAITQKLRKEGAV